jgi:hypothetical protein
MTVFWDVPCSLVKIIRRFKGAHWLYHQMVMVLVAVTTSETSDNFYRTTRHIPEGSRLHNRVRDNTKSQQS